MFWIAVHIAGFLVLTLVSQTGGVAYVAAVFTARRLRNRWIAGTSVFVLAYAAIWAANLAIAPMFGRIPLPCLPSSNTSLQSQSVMYCALNRHYATPKLATAAEALAAHMSEKFPGTKTLTLDAGFPYVDGFPLLPHLSHRDGRKLDLAFWYLDEAGSPTVRTRSPIGYFAFEQPLADSPQPCEGRNDLITLRWDLDFLQSWFAPLALDEARTKDASEWLASEGATFGVDKLFVEPHLKHRFGITAPAIRFQGCRAARHDDHIHFQVSR
ncbi:MAG: hypothetical protein AAF468_05120 [Pseudomonadota bacterium]